MKHRIFLRITFNILFKPAVVLPFIMKLFLNIKNVRISCICTSLEINASIRFVSIRFDDKVTSNHKTSPTHNRYIVKYDNELLIHKRTKVSMAIVVLAGTFDTKGGEYAFVRDKILSLNSVAKIVLVDVGTQSTSDMAVQADIQSSQVVAATGRKYEDLKSLPKTDALQVMSQGLTRILLDLHKRGELHGVMGMGGGCGSTLLAPAFQKLPMGVPKLLVSSTIACVQARPFFSFTDMTIMYSVTDFTGTVNAVNRPIVSNAAVAIASMAADYATNEMKCITSGDVTTDCKREKPVIAATMIGATQKGVVAAMDILEGLGYDFVAFSPNGKQYHYQN
jgi:uncharacterized protein (UPF0261 family)